MKKPIVEKLNNGLKVVMRPNPSAPVVAFQVWVGVGSTDEEKGEEGMAHVLEHMLFKGTKRRAVGEIARDVERAGGQINAWTSYDETVYYITLASRFCDQGLDILADAIQHSALDAEELQRELQVIREEIKMGEDSPDQVLVKELFKSMFKRHPYGRPVIGYDRTVKGFTRKTVMAFYKRWYIPKNMVLTIAGDFDPETMLAKVNDEFGSFGPKKAPIRSPRPKESMPRKTKIVSLAKPVGDARFAIAFPIPGLTHEDVPALDILASILGQGMSARLETKVRRELGLVTDIRAMAYTPTDTGIFAIFGICPHHQLKQAIDAALRVLHLDSAPKITDAELRKAKTLIEAESIYSEETVDGLARKAGFYLLHTNDLEFEKKYLNTVSAVTADDISKVANRYLVGSRASVAFVVPDPSRRPPVKRIPWISGRGKNATFDNKKLASTILPMVEAFDSKRPKKRIASKKDKTEVIPLSTGDLLLVRRDPETKLVAARAAFMGGLRFETKEEAGLFALLANTLVRGTQTASAEEVAVMMDALACSISGFSGRNTVGIQGEFLSSNFADGYALMAACLRAPSLLEHEVKREKELLIEDIRQSRDNPSQTAFKLCFKALFGEHPYSRLTQGTEETVSALTVDDLRQKLENATGPGQMVLAVVGGVSTEEVASLTESLFLSSKSGNPPPTSPAPWSNFDEPRQATKNLPKEQSHIVMGFPGTTLTNPDRYAVEVLTEILGGHGGRLFNQIREEKGLAYSVTAVSIDGIEPGYIAFYAGTSPGAEHAVLDAMNDELVKILSAKPKRDELTRIKRHLIGARAIAWQRTSTRAASMSLDQLYGNGHDAGEKYAKCIDSVTANDVIEVAKQYLGIKGRVVTCVGPDAESLKLV